MKYRDDTLRLLQDFVKTGKISIEDFNDTMKRVHELYPNSFDVEKFLDGSTFMTVDDCLSLQKSLTMIDIIKIYKQNAENQRKQVQCILHWPSYITWVHPNDM